MIQATSSLEGPPLEIIATVTGFAVYLDNWAIMNLAKGDTARRKQFVNAVSLGGDLLFSMANVVELCGPQGNSLEAAKRFLDELGPHWVPVELNPFVVCEREQNGESPSRSCMSRGLLEAYFKNRTHDCSPGSGKVIDLSPDSFRLGPVMDWVAGSPLLSKAKVDFDQVVKNEVGAARRRSTIPPMPFNPSKPATFTSYNLVRTLVETKGVQIKRGDGLDFCHAVIGSAFARFAALDKQWKRRVESLPKPNGLARIYSDLDEMVSDIASLHNSSS